MTPEGQWLFLHPLHQQIQSSFFSCFLSCGGPAGIPPGGCRRAWGRRRGPRGRRGIRRWGRLPGPSATAAGSPGIDTRPGRPGRKTPNSQRQKRRKLWLSPGVHQTRRDPFPPTDSNDRPPPVVSATGGTRPPRSAWRWRASRSCRTPGEKRMRHNWIQMRIF